VTSTACAGSPRRPPVRIAVWIRLLIAGPDRWAGTLWENQIMTAEVATTPLASHAIAPGGRVEIMLPNGPAFPVSFYGALDLVVLDPGGQYRPVRPARVPPSIAHLVTTGGMAGWQITLIAPGRPPDHPPGSCTRPEPGPSRQEKTMMMSRAASRLAGDFAILVPNANRHRPFSFDGQALGAGAEPPALAARSGASDCVTPLRSHRCPASQGRQPDRRPEAAGVEGTAIWLP
jgi:hypothetical protein